MTKTEKVVFVQLSSPIMMEQNVSSVKKDFSGVQKNENARIALLPLYGMVKVVSVLKTNPMFKIINVLLVLLLVSGIKKKKHVIVALQT